MPTLDPAALLSARYGPGPSAVLSVPGRVNLIGEHIDYHLLPVLPIAIDRRIQIAFRRREDRRIRAASDVFGDREFDWTPRLQASPAGDWENYLKAAAMAVQQKWELRAGIDVAVVSDLPPAAGLSSSSALLTGITLALLRANGVDANFEELMQVLPEGEYFVGTRGGGMDHAAVLACRQDCALLIHFAPVSATPVPIPPDLAFLVAHSLTTAEKSGGARAEYNARRTAGSSGLRQLGFDSFAEALAQHSVGDLKAMAASRLRDPEQRCFRHVITESGRVTRAVEALEHGDGMTLGSILNASHVSLRDDLRISNADLDELVVAATASGALGARLTGAGFGGCAVILCRANELEKVRAGVVERYYARRSGFVPEVHLLAAKPCAGALYL
ncbi:galactokinase [uncultured Paludibaculum sp.]|uniref:galactokinase n=1 Tax=uncultured Paludibaculum sp. TaxID=1765020 RepID=UPI002AAB5EF7|nr:galactokinase [uncultured Paludibaculum sp.]